MTRRLRVAPCNAHTGFTPWPLTAVILGDMKMQLVTLFGLAAYLVWTTTFAGLLVGVIAPGG